MLWCGLSPVYTNLRSSDSYLHVCLRREMHQKIDRSCDLQLFTALNETLCRYLIDYMLKKQPGITHQHGSTVCVCVMCHSFHGFLPLLEFLECKWSSELKPQVQVTGEIQPEEEENAHNKKNKKSLK